MKSRPQFFSIFLSVCAALALSACKGMAAQPGDSSADFSQKQARNWSQLIRQHRFEYLIPAEDESEYCAALLHALTGEEVIQFVPPSLETSDPNDKRLTKYQACRNYADWPSGVANSNEAFVSLRQLGDGSYKVYPLRGIGSETHSAELIYAANSEEKLKLNQLSGFWQVDLDRCVITNVVPSGINPIQSQDANAVGIFRDEYVILDLYNLDGPLDRGSHFGLQAFKRRASGAFEFACGWRD